MADADGTLVIRTPSEGRRFRAGGDLYRFLAEASETGGRLGLWDAEVPPRGGPPLHLHRREGEAFFVYEGEIDFVAGGAPVRLGPGGFVHIPEGIPHAFTNPTDRPARMLVMVFPGGMEQMFRETGEEVHDPAATPRPLGPEEISRLQRVAPSYGIELLGPPLSHQPTDSHDV